MPPLVDAYDCAFDCLDELEPFRFRRVAGAGLSLRGKPRNRSWRRSRCWTFRGFARSSLQPRPTRRTFIRRRTTTAVVCSGAGQQRLVNVCGQLTGNGGAYPGGDRLLHIHRQRRVLFDCQAGDRKDGNRTTRTGGPFVAIRASGHSRAHFLSLCRLYSAVPQVFGRLREPIGRLRR